MREGNVWSVYVHTNKTNGKRYFGITSMKPRDRWRYGYGYGGCRYFHYAIEKYGWDGFDHEILATGLTQREAEFIEQFYIEVCKTRDRRYGYNIAPGGNVKTLSPEGLESMRAALSGANAPNATPVVAFDLAGKKVAEFSTIHEAELHFNAKCLHEHIFSRHGTRAKHIIRLKSDVGDAEFLSEEEVADALAVKYSNGIAARVHAVVVFDAVTGERLGDFPTVKSAGEHFGTYFDKILCGQVQTQKGLTAKYAEDCVGVERLSDDEIKSLRVNHGEKEVFKFDLDQNFIRSYSSLHEAANDIGGSVNAISLCLCGKTKSSGGYLWSYSRSVVPAKTNTIWEARRKNGSKTGTPVDKIDLETGKVLQTYPSIGLAAKDAKTYITSITEVINHVGNHVSAGGFGWKRHDEGRG